MTTTVPVDTQTQTLEEGSHIEVDAKPKAKTIVKIMAIVTPLLSFAAQNLLLIMAMAVGGSVHSIEIAMLAGNLAGFYLTPLIIMLLFQIGKRFRNPRSRWAIFLNTALFFLVVSILSAIVKMLV